MDPNVTNGMRASALLALMLMGFCCGVVTMYYRYKLVIGALKAVSVNISYSAQVYQSFGPGPERPAMSGGMVDVRYLPPQQQQPYIVSPIPRYRQLEGGDR